MLLRNTQQPSYDPADQSKSALESYMDFGQAIINLKGMSLSKIQDNRVFKFRVSKAWLASKKISPNHKITKQFIKNIILNEKSEVEFSSFELLSSFNINKEYIYFETKIKRMSDFDLSGVESGDIHLLKEAINQIIVGVRNHDPVIKKILQGIVNRAPLSTASRSHHSDTRSHADLPTDTMHLYLQPEQIAQDVMNAKIPRWRDIKKEKGTNKYTPVHFIQEYYGKWLGKGLMRKHILSKDEELYYAISRYFRLYGDVEDKIPANFYLPTGDEVTSDWVARVKEGTAKAPDDERFIGRFARANYRQALRHTAKLSGER